ncbi:MAG: DUF5716 family protein [Clostridiales bacterium]|jgi:molecular chaperone DnaK (HSP70)|nr:DUF5716 family protein [Clostridiales bacterium]
MNWKQFKNLSSGEKLKESHFMLGIDLGNATSSIAFYDCLRGAPELIDISGGYGKPSVPTVMQYIPETKEWVFGEYAVLNKGLGRDVTLRYLIEKLGRKEYIDVGSRAVSNVNILSIYLKELIGSIKNINPKAEIVGIVASVPAYMGEDAKEELMWAFKAAGYEKEMISFISDRECVFNRFFFDRESAGERLLLLDFGSRELRGGLYETQGGKGTLRCAASLFDYGLGAKKLEDALFAMFTDAYRENFSLKADLPSQTKDQIYSFMYQHKDMLFQKKIAHKPVRLYFNFTYPPFQKSINAKDMEQIIAPFKAGFSSFVNAVIERGGGRGRIDTVLCVGGGFEMLWAKDAITGLFPESGVYFFKNAKGVIAEGAALAAAAALGVTDGAGFIIEDLNQMKFDIGIQVRKEHKERFVPIIERNSFWWQERAPQFLMLNTDTAGAAVIGLYRRDENGETALLKDLALRGLPLRPRGTLRMKLRASMRRFDELTLQMCDDGFGDFFPKTDYELTERIEIPRYRRGEQT